MSLALEQDFANYLSLQVNLIEQQLAQLLHLRENPPYASLFHAARYSLLGGGKRLRPVLALVVAETLGGSLEKALHPACALEMIHAYSLIHDDLPCMDDDDFRRGKPSLHRAYPEGHAVLTGDFLLTYAFEILANAPGISAENKVKLVALLSRQAGGEGMIAGQVMDLEAEGKEIALDQLKLIHAKKTGALITAAIEFGGIVAGATATQQKILLRFGQEIGLAFQIRDDILDVIASKQKHGKVVGSDALNNKVTYVTALGLVKAKEALKDLEKTAVRTAQELPGGGMRLVQLTQHTLQL